jgi:PAS domain S-box-containing protein
LINESDMNRLKSEEQMMAAMYEEACLTVEASLRANEKKYRSIVDNSLEGIYIVQDNLLKFCNNRLAEMYGFKDPEEAIGTNIQTLISEKSVNLVERELKARENGEKEISHYYYFARRLDGKEFEVETLGSKILYKGKPAIQGVLRDVSKQRELEAQLRQAQKMEAIGSLAGGIAHDFNNILSIIIGYSDISMSSLDNKEKMQYNLEHILKAAHRAKDLVHQILSFSRQGETEKGPIKVVPIVKEVLKLIRASLPSTIEIKQNIRYDKYIIYADPTQLHQVLMNLCTNAAHAMRQHGGVLEIEISDLNCDLASISENSVEPAPYMRLTVKDTGFGMTQEVKERIFDPFFTTKQVGEGTGLGLSVVHGIVTSLDGEISVESEPGQGTTFHLFFPLLKDNTPVSSIVGTRKNLPRGKERIMLVDDEVSLVNMGQKMLGQLGYDIVAIEHSDKALSIFREDPDSFQLIITDLTMPGLTGIQLAAEIKKIKPELPIILCTGFSKELNRSDLKDLGISDLLLKPYDMGKIATMVRQVIDQQVV